MTAVEFIVVAASVAAMVAVAIVFERMADVKEFRREIRGMRGPKALKALPGFWHMVFSNKQLRYRDWV